MWQRLRSLYYKTLNHQHDSDAVFKVKKLRNVALNTTASVSWSFTVSQVEQTGDNSHVAVSDNTLAAKTTIWNDSNKAGF